MASLHAFPLLAGIDRTGMVGKLFAVRPRALAEAGGFAALRDRLGEDVALARRLRRAGWRVSVAATPAIHGASGRASGSVVARLSRWVRVVASERPWLLPAYPLLFAPLPLACIALLVGVVTHDLAYLVSASLVFAARLAVAKRRGLGLRIAVHDAFLADVVLLAAFARTVVTRSFEWRGRSLRLGPGGRLVRAGQEERSRQRGEQDLRDPTEERRTPLVEQRELSLTRSVDPRELGLDRATLRLESGADVARALERRPEGDPEIRRLGPREHVTNADPHDPRTGRELRDVRRARTQLEGRERRALSPLGIDPNRPARPIEQGRRVPHGACSVPGVVEVDAEATDEPEERKPSKVASIHHRVRVESEMADREPERHERVPPGRVIGDQEQGRVCARPTRVLHSANVDAPERTAQARVCVTGEPTGERSRPARGDHERRPS